jgi:hypothetical protein
MFVVTTVVVFALLLCALAISSMITRLYLENKRKNDPSYDEYEEEEAREAGLPITISRKHAQAALHVFAGTFMVCCAGIVCSLIAYYGLSVTAAIFILTTLFSFKKCVVITIFVLVSYAVATTYFSQDTNNDKKGKSQDEQNRVDLWSLFKIKFAGILQKKDTLYLDDAMAFYRTLGYFWMILFLLLFFL